MKIFLDFFPILVFVGIYFYSGVKDPMQPAVIGLIIASAIQTVGSRLLTGKFEKLHLWTLLITSVFGAMTVVFHDAAYVQWKASILVWVMAGIFLYRQFILNKLFIKEMLSAAIEENLDVPENIWKKINLIWPVGYILFGFLNLYIAFNFSEAFWVKFKLFGLMGLTLTLVIYTISKIFPYIPKEESNQQTDFSEKTSPNKSNEKE
ncbi:inner membrane-spanning protein YciB [Aliikangiella maris]|uniref:Inner membrane-spanning protein YciB n=2 Tax=Aliikangiella maris TaxID=3162458 RepID=A0ABV3MLD5_9GAMM